MAINKKLLAYYTIGLPILFFGSMAGTNLYLQGNTTYQSEYKEEFSKIDGINSYTKVTKYKKNDSVKVKRYNMFEPDVSYTDKDGDQLVDLIETHNSGRNTEFIELNREEDFKKYSQKFNDADRDFRKQIKRFKPLMNR